MHDGGLFGPFYFWGIRVFLGGLRSGPRWQCNSQGAGGSGGSELAKTSRAKRLNWQIGYSITPIKSCGKNSHYLLSGGFNFGSITLATLVTHCSVGIASPSD